MGKKGSWISALKKAFAPSSKDNVDSSTGKYVKNKKWGLGRQRHREISSFIPLYGEPSSIEKILGDVDQEKQSKARQVPNNKFQQPKASTTRTNGRDNLPTTIVSNKAETAASNRKKNITTPAKSIIPNKQATTSIRKSIGPSYAQISATKIQAAYRGYVLLTVTPKTANTSFSDARSGGFPFLWNWREQQVPSDPQYRTTPGPTNPKTSATIPTAGAALLRRGTRRKPARTPFEASTPVSLKSVHTRNSSNRWQATQVTTAIKDDDSLTSCPAFMAPSEAAVPSYMAPTVSTKAKVRTTSVEGGGKEGRRRFSFAPTQSIGSLRLFSEMKSMAPVPSTAGRNHRSVRSVGELSVDSTVSLPTGLGRRPLK